MGLRLLLPHARYGFTTNLTGLTFDEALDKTTAGLQAEGFGVLSDIDVQRAIKENRGADMRPCRTLGASIRRWHIRLCRAEPDIGLLLPCNVIVREESPGRVVVARGRRGGKPFESGLRRAESRGRQADIARRFSHA
ncbi:hypothetical protein BURC_03976 [Burkholderiaceae bacterium]|nr:hypothetical protein BURC_03976 [Burkholderiaceae bacterium]